jgi:hypothetical protein
MFAYAERPDVMHYGCKALANMGAWGGGWEAVIAAGGASAAVAAIRTHGGGEGGGAGGAAAAASSTATASVLHYACKALAVVAAGPEGVGGAAGTPGRDAAVKAGALRALFSVASAPGVCNEALYYAIKGAVPLASTAASSELRERVLGMGWPALVAGALARNGEHLALVSVGLRFLAAMSKAHTGGRAAVLAGGGAPLVVALLASHGAEHASVAAAGIAVLNELVDGTPSEIEAFAAAGAVKAIVAAMRVHEGAEGSVEVARVGCSALAHCAVFLQAATREAGGVEAVERAEFFHGAECGVVAREAARALAVKYAPGSTPLISAFAARPPLEDYLRA